MNCNDGNLDAKENLQHLFFACSCVFTSVNQASEKAVPFVSSNITQQRLQLSAQCDKNIQFVGVFVGWPEKRRSILFSLAFLFLFLPRKKERVKNGILFFQNITKNELRLK